MPGVGGARIKSVEVAGEVLVGGVMRVVVQDPLVAGEIVKLGGVMRVVVQDPLVAGEIVK